MTSDDDGPPDIPGNPPDEVAWWRDDRGQMGGIEALPFGVLIFVVGSLLVANAWGVVDAKLAATTAAREASRAYVEAADGPSAARDAQQAAHRALEGHGRDPSRSGVTVTHDGGAGFARCVRIRAQVTYTVPAIPLPFIGGYGRGFAVTASHSELIDPYRDDVPGQATC